MVNKMTGTSKYDSKYSEVQQAKTNWKSKCASTENKGSPENYLRYGCNNS